MRLLASTTKRTFNHTTREYIKMGKESTSNKYQVRNAKKDIVIDEFSFAKLSFKTLLQNTTYFSCMMLFLFFVQNLVS